MDGHNATPRGGKAGDFERLHGCAQGVCVHPRGQARAGAARASLLSHWCDDEMSQYGFDRGQSQVIDLPEF